MRIEVKDISERESDHSRAEDEKIRAEQAAKAVVFERQSVDARRAKLASQQRQVSDLVATSR